MPKKLSSARGSSQRQRAKAQKSIELVRPVTSEEPQIEESAEEEEQTLVAVAETKSSRRERRGKRDTVAATILDDSEAKEEEEQPEKEVEAAAPRGAAARIAERRKATLRAQQRSAQSLISPEHFAYVTRDLITIGVLASLMLAIIIVLYFTIGRTL